MKQTLALLVAVFLLAACVRPGHPHGCPPGQAKKGNCVVVP